MPEQILFTEKVRNPKKLNDWIFLRRVMGVENNGEIEVTDIQLYDKDGHPISMNNITNIVNNFDEVKDITDVVDDDTKIGLDNLQNVVRAFNESIDFTVHHAQSIDIINHAEIVEVLDSLTVDTHGRLLSVATKKFQLPYPSAVAQINAPTAEDTVIWIKTGEEGEETVPTIALSNSEPSTSTARIYVVTDSGETVGIISRYRGIPKNSSSIMWIQDSNTASETLGTAYNSSDTPPQDGLVEIQE